MISFTLGQAAPALTTIENVACLPGKILYQCDMLQKLATHPASKDRINKPGKPRKTSCATSTAPGWIWSDMWTAPMDFRRLRIERPYHCKQAALVLGYVTEQDFKRWVRPADMSIPTKHKKLFQSRQGCFSA
jgi:hypothetical protein